MTVLGNRPVRGGLIYSSSNFFSSAFIFISSSLMTFLHLRHLILWLFGIRMMVYLLVFGIQFLFSQSISLNDRDWHWTDSKRRSYLTMHHFMLLDPMIQFISKNVAVKQITRCGFIAVCLLLVSNVIHITSVLADKFLNEIVVEYWEMYVSRFLGYFVANSDPSGYQFSF